MRWRTGVVLACVWLMVGCGGSDADGPDGASVDAAPDAPIDAGPPDAAPAVLTIAPASARLDVVDGTIVPQQFQALVDGTPVTAVWSLSATAAATVGSDGLVTPTGNAGGAMTLTASAGGDTATASVEVHLAWLDNPAGASEAQRTALEAATQPDPSTTWTYPYDGTRWPLGLPAPEMMWNGGGSSDLYLVQLEGPFASVKVFTQAAPPSRFTLAPGRWSALGGDAAGGQLSLRVHRLVPPDTAATVVADDAWTIATAPLPGVIFYTDFANARVQRLVPGDAAPTDPLAAASITGCTGCHRTSSDGTTMIIGGDVATSTFDLATGTPVLQLANVGKSPRNWAMAAVSPDGQTLVENNATALSGPPGGADGMWDTETGAKLTGTGLDSVLLDMPTFSPDATRLVFVDHATGGLAAYRYDPSARAVSDRTDVVAAGLDTSLDAIGFPSVLPDGAWALYYRGAYPDSLDSRFGDGDLYLANLGTGEERRLAAANGDDYPFAAGARDRHVNYHADAAPIAAGGYAWVVFVSRRSYGNRLTSSRDLVKQLWVTAIDLGASGDPSSPPFWLPGQDLTVLNGDPSWSLLPP